MCNADTAGECTRNKARAATLHANAEAELDTEEVEHLGEQNMRTELMERCVQKSGNVTAGGFFSQLAVRVRCLHAALLAFACVVVCFTQTASVRKTPVRLDVIRRKVAGWATMPAMRAGACISACPIIAASGRVPHHSIRCGAMCLLGTRGRSSPPCSLAGGERPCGACGAFQSGCCASGLSAGQGSRYALRRGLLACFQGLYSADWRGGV